jgi:hypothetical protein
MNFYSASVALLWATAMRCAAPATAGSRRPPTSPPWADVLFNNLDYAGRAARCGFAGGFNDLCGDNLRCDKPRRLFRSFLSRGTISFID